MVLIADKSYKTCHRYNEPGDAHFLTFSCFKQKPFLNADRSKTWLADSVVRACEKHNTAIWGYVFMPEHVHLLVKPREPVYDFSEYMRSV